MLFGGTNWGHTYEPTVYSSYDYGAGRSFPGACISQFLTNPDRNQRESHCYTKDERDANARCGHGPLMSSSLLPHGPSGYFLRVSPDLLASNFNGNGTNYTTNSLLYAVELRNPDTGAAFYFVRHSDSTYAYESTACVLVLISIGLARLL